MAACKYDDYIPASSFESFRHAHMSLIPTRSNTPEDFNSPNSASWSSNKGSPLEPATPTVGSEILDGSSFEIDVRPRRRKFSNMQERNMFVEEYKRKFKTEMCKNWELRGCCKFGDKCCFAHGRHELKEKALTHVKYKTKPCKQYHQTGYCPYGQRCQYLHKEALFPNIFFRPQEERTQRGFYTYEMLHEVNVLCGTDVQLETVLEKLPVRPRLGIFAHVETSV